MEIYGFHDNNTQYWYFEENKGDLDITNDGVLKIGDRNIEIKLLNNIKNEVVKYNIDKLKNDPKLSFIKSKLNKLGDDIIATNGTSEVAKAAYIKFFNTTFEILLGILKNADELYWFDKTKLKRSEYSAEECFNLSINLALEIMKMKQIVSNIDLPQDVIYNEVSYTKNQLLKEKKEKIGVNYDKKSTAKTVKSVKTRGSKSTKKL